MAPDGGSWPNALAAWMSDGPPARLKMSTSPAKGPSVPVAVVISRSTWPQPAAFSAWMTGARVPPGAVRADLHGAAALARREHLCQLRRGQRGGVLGAGVDRMVVPVVMEAGPSSRTRLSMVAGCQAGRPGWDAMTPKVMPSASRTSTPLPATASRAARCCRARFGGVPPLAS